MKIKIQLLTALAISILLASPAFATPITIQIEGVVNWVDDWGDTLGDQINVGDSVTGSYTYDSETPDSTPSLTSVAQYYHDVSPYGIVLNIGALEFKTNPSDVDFLIEIANDYPSYAPVDNYLLRSYNNLPLPNGTQVEHISWQLDDNSAKAISSIELPIVAPVLADWPFSWGIQINGGKEFYISAEVLAATLVPEPCCIMLILGGIVLLRQTKI